MKKKICKYCRFWKCSAPIDRDQEYRIDKHSGFCFRFFHPQPPTSAIAEQIDSVRNGDETMMSILWNASGRQLFVSNATHSCSNCEI